MTRGTTDPMPMVTPLHSIYRKNHTNYLTN
jgi:hypothetical protein